MTELGEWLRRELQKRELTQNAAAVYAGVGQATISDMLNKGHVPKVETLFRLADFFGTPRELVLRLAGHLPPASTPAETGSSGQEDALVRDLLEEFQQVPDEWKPVAVEQVATFRRLAELRPPRFIGEEDESGEALEAEGGGAEERESESSGRAA